MVQDTEANKMTCDVFVRNPVNMCDGGACCTFYEIIVQTNRPCFSLKESFTRRRFSEFVWLAKILKKQHPKLILPPLPPKSWFHRFNPDFIRDRCELLEEFLRKILRIPLYLSNRALHFFLQSNLTIDQIDDNLSGKRDDDIVDLGIDLSKKLSVSDEDLIFHSGQTTLGCVLVENTGEEPAETVYVPAKESRVRTTKPICELMKKIPSVVIERTSSDIQLESVDSMASITDSAIESSCSSFEGPDHLHNNYHPTQYRHILLNSRSNTQRTPRPNKLRKSVSFCKEVIVMKIDHANRFTAFL